MRGREAWALVAVSLLGLAMAGCIGDNAGQSGLGTASTSNTSAAEPGTVNVDKTHDYTEEDARIPFSVPNNTRLGELDLSFQHWTPTDEEQVGVCSTSGEVRMAILTPSADVFKERTVDQSGGLALGIPPGDCGSSYHVSQDPGPLIPAGEWTLVFEGQGYIVGSVTFAS